MMTCEETLQVELAFLNPGYNDIETDWDTGLLKVDGQVLAVRDDLLHEHEPKSWQQSCIP